MQPKQNFNFYQKLYDEVSKMARNGFARDRSRVVDLLYGFTNGSFIIRSWNGPFVMRGPFLHRCQSRHM